MSKKRLLWLGYGDIAEKCLPLLRAQACEITAVCRSEKQAPVYADLVRGDLGDFGFITELLAQGFEHIVITLTPGGRDEDAYRASYLRVAEHLAEFFQTKHLSSKPKQLIFVSSTSVYHQQDGSWVTEASETLPMRDTAIVLLEAEKVLLDLDFDVQCLRFSGIYGGKRNFLIKQVLAGNGGSDQWTNRIHSEDCAGVIAFLVGLAAKGAELPTRLLASDNHPVESREIRSWIAKKLELPLNHLRYSESESRVQNKRCNNALLRSLGYEFLYPTFREGYEKQLDQQKAALLSQLQQ